MEKFIQINNLIEIIEFSINQAFYQEDFINNENIQTILYYSLWKHKETFIEIEDNYPIILDVIMIKSFLKPIFEVMQHRKFDIFHDTIFKFYRAKGAICF